MRCSPWLNGFAMLVGLTTAANNGVAQDIPQPPPYHDKVPAKPLPKVLDPARLEDPAIRKVYELAGLIREVLYQQPCYCYCNRSLGHSSLLDCFAGPHGTICLTCRQEAVYCYLGKQHGKTAAEIRAGIMKGEWHDIEDDSVSSISLPPTPAKPPNGARK